MKSLLTENRIYSAIKSIALEAFRFTQCSTENTVKDIVKSAAIRMELSTNNER